MVEEKQPRPPIDIEKILFRVSEMIYKHHTILDVPEVLEACNFHMQADAPHIDHLIEACNTIRPKSVWADSTEDSVTVFCSWALPENLVEMWALGDLTLHRTPLTIFTTVDHTDIDKVNVLKDLEQS